MKFERAILFVSLCTLLGMIGLYVGAYLAWQKYQSEKAALAADPLGTLKGLLL